MKKRGIRAIDGFRKKLMIPDFEIPKCPEFEVKSKMGKYFMNEKFLEEFLKNESDGFIKLIHFL